MRSSLLMLLGIGAAACRRADDAPPLFERLAPSTTGVTFENRLPEDSALNILNFLYYYNGGGVAVGDVNGDGLPDLYFTSNLGTDRALPEPGQLPVRGRDGTRGRRRSRRVEDRRDDGRRQRRREARHLRVDGQLPRSARAQRAVHQQWRRHLHRPHEGVRARSRGLLHPGRLLRLRRRRRPRPVPAQLLDARRAGERRAQARRARRERGRSAVPQRRRPLPRRQRRRRASTAAAKGSGSASSSSDFNLDGCPDVYVANDFQENDFLYLNNCNGTFTESIARRPGTRAASPWASTRPTSTTTAGPTSSSPTCSPSARIDPQDRRRARRSSSSSSCARARAITRSTRATRSSSIAATDDSARSRPRGRARHRLELGAALRRSRQRWPEGSLRHERDLSPPERPRLHRPTSASRRCRRRSADTITKANLALLKRMPHRPGAQPRVPQHGRPALHQRDGGVGARPAGLLEWRGVRGSQQQRLARSRRQQRSTRRRRSIAIADARGTGNSSLTVALRGSGAQHARHRRQAVRLEQGRDAVRRADRRRAASSRRSIRVSTSDSGRDSVVDSLLVVWPDRSMQLLTNVPANRLLTLSQGRRAAGRWYAAAARRSAALPRRHGDARQSTFGTTRTHFVDYDREPLMPQLLSTEGPALAVADVNGDGLRRRLRRRREVAAGHAARCSRATARFRAQRAAGDRRRQHRGGHRRRPSSTRTATAIRISTS